MKSYIQCEHNEKYGYIEKESLAKAKLSTVIIHPRPNTRQARV